MKKLIHCSCGFKFEVYQRSKVVRCYECIAKTKRMASKGKKPLDVAFEKLDKMLADKIKNSDREKI